MRRSKSWLREALMENVYWDDERVFETEKEVENEGNVESFEIEDKEVRASKQVLSSATTIGSSLLMKEPAYAGIV